MNSSQTIHQLAEDIYQVRLPLPFALKQVNCYLVKGTSGWTVLDTGLNTPSGQAAWREAFRALEIEASDIHQIVLTHTHPDHYGMAGWLQNYCKRRSSADAPPVLMSAREARTAASFWGPNPDWKKTVLNFWRSCGVPVELAMAITAATGQMRLRVLPHPSQVKIISAGNELLIGDRQTKILQVSGHSDGQLIFYDQAAQLLFCGDQLLLGITPNISVWPHSDPNPLGQFLASLDKLSTLKVRTALPGHRGLITDFQGRIGELKEHHAERLRHALATAQPMVTAFEAAQQIFPLDKLSVHEKRFAVAETAAHLDYLVERKQLRRETGGVRLYIRA